MAVSADTLDEEWRVAYTVLPDVEKALEGLGWAVAQLPYSSAQQLENRRPRDDEQDSGERDAYRSLTGQRELLRFLLFSKLR